MHTRRGWSREETKCLAVALNSYLFHAAAAQFSLSSASYCLWQGRLGESRVNPPGVWGWFWVGGRTVELGR